MVRWIVGRLDEGFGKGREGYQHPYPSPTLQECLIWAKMVAHGETKIYKSGMDESKESGKVLDGVGERFPWM